MKLLHMCMQWSSTSFRRASSSSSDVAALGSAPSVTSCPCILLNQNAITINKLHKQWHLPWKGKGPGTVPHWWWLRYPQLQHPEFLKLWSAESPGQSAKYILISQMSVYVYSVDDVRIMHVNPYITSC